MLCENGQNGAELHGDYEDEWVFFQMIQSFILICFQYLNWAHNMVCYKVPCNDQRYP